MYSLITLILIVTVVIFALKNYRLRRAREYLAHQLDETALILEGLRDGLLECDTQMIVTRANHAVEDILGMPIDRIVNRKIPAVLLPPKDGSGISYDVFLPPPSEKKLRVFTIPKTDRATKALAGYIKIIRDVSIETVVEKHKGDLVSIVSHQLLTPLTSIKWIFKSLIDGDCGPVNDKQKELMLRGLAANDSMIGLVTDILDVTKIEEARFSYKKESQDIVFFVRDIVASRAEKAQAKNIKIEMSSSVPSAQISFDKTRTAVALGNVLDNAVDYSPTGGIIKVNLSVDKTKAAISVADMGIGVPEVAQAQLFSKFFRAENAKRVRNSGTGLGLYLAKHIMEDQGGTITLTSNPGEGALFTLTLPVALPLTTSPSV